MRAALGGRLRSSAERRVQELGGVARNELVGVVRGVLRERRAAFEDASRYADGLTVPLRAAERGAAGVLVRLDRTPFSASMTVHVAHARHPGVGAIFARHGLPRCPDCAVGADETLAEAALGEGLPLEVLLAELRPLLTQI